MIGEYNALYTYRIIFLRLQFFLPLQAGNLSQRRVTRHSSKHTHLSRSNKCCLTYLLALARSDDGEGGGCIPIFGLHLDREGQLWLSATGVKDRCQIVLLNETCKYM